MDTQKDKKLKPCPFCHGKVTVGEDWVDAITNIFIFSCGDCNVSVFFDFIDGENEAIEAWNRRA